MQNGDFCLIYINDLQIFAYIFIFLHTYSKYAYNFLRVCPLSVYRSARYLIF